MSTEQRSEHAFDVVVLGGGSAAEALVRQLDGSGLTVAVVEHERVGGECPFVACMPSKSMLHDASRRIGWDAAVRHRADVVEHLDDTAHARSLRENDATLVRGYGRLVDAHTVAVGDVVIRAEHLVLATGSQAVIPPIEGLETLGDLRWTSGDALVANDQPHRVLTIGGGVIGVELAQAFAGFGTRVVLVDEVDRGFPDLRPRVGAIVDAALAATGVEVRRGVGVRRVVRRGETAIAELDDGSTVEADRVLVAVGKRARTAGIGLEVVGLDPEQPLPVGLDARVDCPGSVWAIGDVAGKGQYTHLANHHGAVLANQLRGDARRRFDDVVTPSCVFTAPPVITVGPSPVELDHDSDIVWAEHELDEVPRSATDSLGPGYLAVAARRSTGTIAAAYGVGERFDELIHALVVAIDGHVTLSILARCLQPFPTIGEILGLAFRSLDAQLTKPAGALR